MFWTLIFLGLIVSGLASVLSTRGTNWFTPFGIIASIAAVAVIPFGQVGGLLVLGGFAIAFGWSALKRKDRHRTP